jgi:hypothetical protein
MENPSILTHTSDNVFYIIHIHYAYIHYVFPLDTTHILLKMFCKNILLYICGYCFSINCLYFKNYITPFPFMRVGGAITYRLQITCSRRQKLQKKTQLFVAALVSKFS